MCLDVEVGILADLLEHDPEGAKRVRKHFSEINLLLKRNGLVKHKEPRVCKVWSASGYGYSGLHALREVAGLLWKGNEIPRNKMITGQEETPFSDELFEKASAIILADPPSKFSRLSRNNSKSDEVPFIHLVAHSDAAGYYIPSDFPIPLFPYDLVDETADLWPLGSVPMLKHELEEIIKELKVPSNINSQSEILAALIESPNLNNDVPLWEAQPIATYSALVLLEACVHSKTTGAAIAFV